MYRQLEGELTIIGRFRRKSFQSFMESLYLGFFFPSLDKYIIQKPNTSVNHFLRVLEKKK